MDFNKITSTKIKRIIWAVDPFESDVALDPPTVQELGEWAAANQVEIEPVYVFTPFGEIEKLAAEKLASKTAKMIRELKVNTKDPFVLIRPVESSQGTAVYLLSYAQDTGTDLILVSSHGRRGFPRMLFGSFAETLLNTSPIPLLFLNKNARPAKASFQKALWATDFSKPCEFAFSTFLAQASRLCKQITLFHDITLPLELSLYFSQWDVGIPPMGDIAESQMLWAKQESEEWLNRAKQAGFEIQFEGITSRGRIASEILGMARQNACGMIAMASQSGPVGSAMMGSHSREVFKASEFPILLYGPQICEAAKKLNRNTGVVKNKATAQADIQIGAKDETGMHSN